MATYKVIQDIEAEDKLVGPLSFRQFVYFLIAAFLGYLCFISVAKGAGFLLVILLPPTLFCLFFAWPWTPDQPTEIWALARIRFYFKPRKRIWDQSGVKELVTITVPKKIERVYTDGLSQTEVRSRLQALASTIDTRGWAVKNANVNMSTAIIQPALSDRLVDFSSMPQQVSNIDVRADDDILDADNNPAASQMTAMIDASTKAHRQSLISRLQAQGASTPTPAAAPAWFMQSYGQQPEQRQPGSLPSIVDAQAQAMPAPIEPPLPKLNPDANKDITKHLKIIDPLGDAAAQQKATQPMSMPVPPTQPAPVAAQPAPAPVPSQPNPAILNLAHDNNLNVSTLAREAKRVKEGDNGEVVVSLR